MKTLTIKNFGPIKDIEIEIKKLTILIGSQGSGKSIVAKLVAIFNDIDLFGKTDLKSYLKVYNIDFPITQDTYIKYQSENYFYEFTNNQLKDHFSVEENTLSTEEMVKSIFECNAEILFDAIREEDLSFNDLVVYAFLKNTKPANKLSNDFNSKVLSLYRKIKLKKHLSNCLYIPSERNLFALVNENIYKWIDKISLPKCIIKFGDLYMEATKAYQQNDVVKIPFIDSLSFVKGEAFDEIIFHEATTKLSEGSSGFQSSIPLALVCIRNSKNKQNQFIIEEPEQNLYPQTQYKLVKFLAESCLQNENSLLIATHSPYILSSFSNLMQAHNASLRNTTKTSRIIEKKYWIDFNSVQAYYLNDGVCKHILNDENHIIDANHIDDVSFELDREYSKLLDIELGR
ncbi:MAG TPA: AAA family ATPase [Candidatus Cloacimonadota bacterium]|nr:AAA family ATPase [Candidatus Cloacimonadota bacterium]